MQERIERNRYKSQTLILKSDFNSQNFNYVPSKKVDEKSSLRHISDIGQEMHTPHQDLSKINRRETFQLESEMKHNGNNSIQRQGTLAHQQIPIKKIMSSNQTPIGSQKSININVLKKQSTIGNIFHGGSKGLLISSANVLEQKDNSPMRSTKNIFYRGSENNLRSSEILFSPDKTAFPSLNKSGLLKQNALPLVNSHGNNNSILSQNLSKSNIFNSTINNSNVLVRMPTRMNTKSIGQFPNGNPQIRATSMNFNPQHFLIQKTTTNFNSQPYNKESSSPQISPVMVPITPIKLDLRESLKHNIRKSMNDFSPVRYQVGSDFLGKEQQKVDNYISLRHSSLVNIDDEGLSPVGNGNQKKILPIQTSNAMLPQSVVNQMKIQKRPTSRQTGSQDILYSPQSDVKQNIQNSSRMFNIERIVQQQKQETYQSGDDSSRVSSKRTIKDIREIQQDKSGFQHNENLKTNNSIFSPEVVDRQEKTKANEFEQTQEQKKFQIDFLQKIRRKQTMRFSQKVQSLQEKLNDEEEELGFKNKESSESSDRQKQKNKRMAREIFEKSLETKQLLNEDTSTQNRAQKVLEISDDFRKLLRHDISRPQTALNKSYLFFLSDIDPKVFIEGVVFLFSNALIISLTNNYEVKKRKYNYKLPEKFFQLICKTFKTRILEERYKFNEAQLDRFEYLVNSQYEEQQLKPQNLLEELGGAKKCQFLIADFYQQVISRLDSKDQFTDKQVQDIGQAFLTNNEEGIAQFINHIKRTKRILEGDIFQVKHALYQYLYVDKNDFFDEEIKKSFLYAFEKIRHKHFTTFTQVDTDQISKDILKYFLTKKPILEYFNEDNRSDRAHFLIMQIIDCFMYQTKTIHVVQWLKECAKKQIDESFFLMLEPLFIEPFKRLKLGQIFTRNAEMKFGWMKIGFNVYQGADQVIERMDELLINMKNWIEGMIQQKQLNKQQLSKISHIQNVSFLKYFIYNVLTYDLFNNSDIYFMLNTFQTSQDAVLFQLKGLKRILLHMRFKPQDAYDIAEYLIKTFNEAFHCAAPQI